MLGNNNIEDCKGWSVSYDCYLEEILTWFLKAKACSKYTGNN